MRRSRCARRSTLATAGATPGSISNRQPEERRLRPVAELYPIAVIDPILRERVHGAMFGLAVGDALGAPVEGSRPSLAAATVASGLMMVGSVSWAPGEWTDDTAMALALAESIGAHELTCIQSSDLDSSS
jgi:ADP-ribosylglycohydrolase